MSQVAQNLGNKIRELRKNKKMSQEELAYKANISPAHLGQIERALKNPTIDTIAQISHALEIPLHELFCFELDHEIQVQNSPVLTKINIHLSTMDENQQRDILRLIRLVKHFNYLK